MAVEKLQVEHVSKAFTLGTGTGKTQVGMVQALEDVSFAVNEHELVALIGPSGCGKTTLLKIVHGLLPADSGTIRVDGRVVSKPGYDRGMVFQHAGLLPWRTAQKNVEFGLEIKGVPADERKRKAKEYIHLVGLRGFEDHHPHQLSGGMQQRIGLARALAIDPEILLMDEPFGALDAQTRQVLQEELLRIHAETKKTILFVTHDLEEAIYLADRVVVLACRPGRVCDITQVDLPRPRPGVVKARTMDEYLVKRAHIWDKIQEGTAPAERSQAV